MVQFTLILALVAWVACPAWAQNDPATMPANSWLSMPNTRMSSVTPANGQFAGTWGVAGPSAVVGAWSGATLDTKRSRLIVFGGGHADYGGNEVYAFDVGSRTWQRLNDPTANPASDDSDQNPDGTPQSRHSYGGLAYLTHVDRLFALGGSIFTSGHSSCIRPWTFDLAAKTWARDATAAPFTPAYDCTCAYDPQTKKLWYCEFTSGTWAVVRGYDVDAKTWSKLPIGSDRGYGCVALDTKRGLLVAVTIDGQVVAYDVRGNGPGQVWTTSGDKAFQNGDAWEAGFDYDPVSDKLVAWRRDKVYVLDPSSKAWTSYNPPGAPATTASGIYGRWRYVPSVNAFILLTSADDEVHFYKMPVSGSPTAPSIVTPPANQTVTEGQSATFSVAAVGTAPLSYQWQKNGGDIDGATGASYTTPAMTPADDGAVYRVIVTNAAGIATSPGATLSVTAFATPAPLPPPSGGGGGGRGSHSRCGMSTIGGSPEAGYGVGLVILAALGVAARPAKK